MASFSLKASVAAAHTLQSLFVREPDGRYVFTSASAVDVQSPMRFSLAAPFPLYSATLELYDDTTEKRYYFPMCASGENAFSLDLNPLSVCSEHGGLFYYCYRMTGPDGERELHCSYRTGEEYLCPPKADKTDFFQLTFYKKRAVLPDWFCGGVMYHIFVDRFFSAGHNPKREDAELCGDWEHGMPELPTYPGAPLQNNRFFGGDLQGITEKLDYLASLGVTCLYLSPIFEAASNHKYDTGDYNKVDAMFGGEAALDSLLSEAGKRGIRLILDGVFNHTGSDSRYFNAYGRYDGIGAAQSPDSPYYSWYSFSEYPKKYACWWGIPILPRLNGESPSLRDFLFGGNGVIRRYLKKGIGGWRLDVADELSDDFLKELKASALAEKQDALIIGEVWEDASDKISYSRRKQYFRGEELDSVMNYPMKDAVIAYVRDGDFSLFLSTAKRIYSHYPKEVQNCLMNLLGTHDTIRILTMLGGDLPQGKTAPELANRRLPPEKLAVAKQRLRLAYLIICMLPGVPCIYYGDEAGMEGYSDPLNRMPYPWGREDKQLVSFFARMGQIRRENAVFADGCFFVPFADADMLCLLRRKDKDCLCAVINRGEKAFTLTCTAPVRDMLSQKKAKSLVIEARSAVLFSMSEEDDFSVKEMPV